MKKIILLCGLILIFAWNLTGQQQTQQDRQLFQSFDKIAIRGHVYDEHQQALEGIKVEIRLAYDTHTHRSEIMGTADFQDRTWDYLVRTLGTDIFAWAESDEEGSYRISGVPSPGAYFLLVRHAEKYLQTRVPIVIHKTGAKEFEADIILRSRKEKEEGKEEQQLTEISKEAQNEIKEAQEAAQNNKVKKAIQYLQKAVELEPEFAEAQYNLGILLRQENKINEAVDHFEKAVELKENYGLALFALGETLNKQEEYSQSTNYLTDYLKVSENQTDERSIQANYLIGMNFFSLKQPVRAVPYLLKVIETTPKSHPNAYILLANSYVMMRDGRNAIKYYKKFLDLFPDAPNVQQVKTILEKLEEMYPPEEDKK